MYSTARACLTLEEASACWYHNLANGASLTEVFDIPTVEEEILEGIAASENEETAGQVLFNVLAM